MSSYVGPIVVGGFPQEKDVVLEDLEGQHTSSIMDFNISFEQSKPWCM
jgi:hypothetical protein